MNHISESTQKSTTIYRCSDGISNFKIRVNIEEIQEERNEEIRRIEGETKVFHWQEKIYGKYEREFYGDLKNCLSPLEKKYHEDVIKLNLLSNDVLFSYVNENEFGLHEEKCVLSKTTTELCNQMNGMLLDKDKVDFLPKNSDEFDFNHSLIDALNNPYGERNRFDVMYIMADLGEYVGETWLKSEYILCTIKYDHLQKLLVIFPDFTNFEPYYIKVNDSKRIFQYRIEDVSEKMPIDVILKENEILNKILAREARMRLQKTGEDFELSPKNKLNVHLFFEIQTGKNFEYTDVYVQYFIDLPENWFCKDPLSLKGTTQTSRAYGNDHLAYFGFPFDVCLEYNIQELGKISTFKAPYIYFEVISKDSWDRFRTEGLTYTILPISQPGVYRYDLHCFRICPKGPSGNLRRFFIGDCSSYDDITWISVPNDHDKKVLNKYGVDTIGTGQINVKVNVIHQSQAFMADYLGGTSRKHEKFILEKLNLSTLVKSIQQVLEAFKVAKRKMIEARNLTYVKDK